MAVIGYIAQFLFIPLIYIFSFRYYRFMVAVSRLLAKIRMTASDISGWDIILWSYFDANSTRSESEESTTYIKALDLSK